MSDKKLENLRKMLEQVDAGTASNRTSGETLESAVLGSPGRETLDAAGPGSLAQQEMAAAQESLDVFVAGGEIDRDQQYMLEAIVMPFKRPVVDVKNNTFVSTQLTTDWRSLATDPAKKQVIEDALLSIGRVEVPKHLQLPYAGTGFVVGDGLIMTNRHVAEKFAMGLGERRLLFIPGQTSKVDFIRELDNEASEALEVVGVRMIHPYWDMALLQVSGLSQQRKPLKLSTVDPGSMTGAEVVTIGYPGFDPTPDREFQQVQSRVFRDVYYVKRMQPGKLRDFEDIESYEHLVPAITHDCSTLGGNSGSAVIDLQSGSVVGLHFAGAYLHANYAVPTIELASDKRVVDAGVLFGGSPSPQPGKYQDYWNSADTESAAPLPASAGAMTQSPATSSTTVAQRRTTSAQGTEVTWTVPLVIRVDIGSANRARDDFASDPSATTGAPLATSQTEGLFGPPAKDFSLSELADLFSKQALQNASFEMETALSLAVASKFVYENGSVVEPFGVGRFGFETCNFIEASNTQCFLGSTSDAVLISFRGTESVGDWLLNLRIITTARPYGRVHTGFLRGFEFVQVQLERLLEQLGNRRLLITGHSLGGALATVAAAEWAERFDVSAVYTFGQPAVGRGGFSDFMATHYQDKFFRFVNNSDVVARVPPTLGHVGRLFHFDKHGAFRASTEALGEEGPDMMTEAEFEEFRANLTKSARTESIAMEESVFTSVSDHSMDRYIEKIKGTVA